jgi:hypothetical protein
MPAVLGVWELSKGLGPFKHLPSKVISLKVIHLVKVPALLMQTKMKMKD